MLLYVLLLFILSISLPPVSLSSACPSRLMTIPVVTLKVPIHITPLCDHHPLLSSAFMQVPPSPTVVRPRPPVHSYLNFTVYDYLLQIVTSLLTQLGCHSQSL